MSNRHFTWAALAAALAGVPPASAAILHSPPVFESSAVLYCTIRNVGGASVTPLIEGVEANGGILASKTFTLAPGQGTSLLVEFKTFATGCRFTVPGNGKTVRAMALYWDGTHYTLAAPAR